ncbi:hypothetical protein GO730_18185 [Spirosoma sp. HMF3257]|uniref:Uncharacterized protein n=1 Tax=Spirosoma telluris TaxID=2183553 RepID=A0A327NK65_9BACT|nr:hypothetical protein [Spirosoma telluris]RAI75597.1 hypothetical protein HMF3257_18110 [Spirosoma telluris]
MKQLILFLFLGLTTACMAQEQKAASAYRGQPTLIYKTRKDYHNLVPVLLSEDKTTIIAYPGPTDIYYQGKLALPTRLKNGYWLDNRGIGLNVAFLNITYQAYAKLSEVPTLAELTTHIIDKNPLTVLYDCGNRSSFKNVVSDLNRAIEAKKLMVYRRVK